ncbi:D-alanyl-D-alanine carboxypeptidase [Eggerthellaceae bacterium zg-997]|nr:D-alanyl-D-alanine carboxypeptidase [Eggerthellaceae bacterium zg-997]
MRASRSVASVSRVSLRAPFQAALCALALSAALLVGGTHAHADVRKADLVGGSTVEALGLSVGQCPDVAADYALLVDSEGRVLFERAGSAPAQIASITKVMTAIVALEHGDPSRPVEVSPNAAAVGESSAGLRAGDRMSFDAALTALLVPSGNDAATAIAEAVGAQILEREPRLAADPQTAFVAKMNQKARELGCEDTLYENPHGLDDDAFRGNLHSTARDQAKVAAHAMSLDAVRRIVGAGDTSITVERDGGSVSIELRTTDALMSYDDRVIGIKTGETLLAGPSFMGAAVHEGVELYAIVLHSSSAQQRFDDTRALFDWGYEHYRAYALVNAERTASGTYRSGAQAPLVARLTLPDRAHGEVDLTVSDPTASLRVFNLEGNISQHAVLKDGLTSVRAGDVVGTLEFRQRNKVVAALDLIACDDVPEPGIWERLGTWFSGLLSGGADKERPTVEIWNRTPIIKSNVGRSA